MQEKILQELYLEKPDLYHFLMFSLSTEGAMELINWAQSKVIPIEPPVIKTEADTVNTVSANQRAKRWAMMNFDKWNEVTGFVDPHISYYDEITALIEDAVEFGYGVALKQPLKEIMKVIKKSEGSL